MDENSRPRRWNVLAIAATIAIAASFLLAAQNTAGRISENNRLRAFQVAADVRACRRINKLDVTIQKQLQVSLTTTPKLTYYKNHPQELQSVLANLRSEIEAFKPQPC